MSATSYRAYLAMTSVEKRLEGFGIGIESFAYSSSDYFKSRVEADLEEGKAPSYWIYPEVRVQLTQSDFSSQLPEDLVYEYDADSDYQQALQKIREEFIRRFKERYPDTEVIRQGGQAYLFWEPLAGFGVGITVGQALCVRVLVRTDIVDVPDPELLEEATKDVPLVKKAKPVYEWSCNDAELFEPAH